MGRLIYAPRRLMAAPGRIAPARKVADPFYSSAAWLAAKRAQPNRWCAVCGATQGLDLDHIVERKDGGADLDPANLRWLCRKHHRRKTAEAKGARAGRRRHRGVVESSEG